MEFRRRLAAWVLLAVFVPVLLLVSLHMHPKVVLGGQVCVECLHHVHHGGHVSSSAFAGIGGCLACQIAGTAFLAVAVLALAAICRAFTRSVCSCALDALAERVRGCLACRAPPLFL